MLKTWFICFVFQCKKNTFSESVQLINHYLFILWPPLDSLDIFLYKVQDYFPFFTVPVLPVPSLLLHLFRYNFSSSSVNRYSFHSLIVCLQSGLFDLISLSTTSILIVSILSLKFSKLICSFSINILSKICNQQK